MNEIMHHQPVNRGQWTPQCLLAPLAVTAAILASGIANAQSVVLPAPRLLITKPLGCQTGTSVNVLIKAQHSEEANELRFSHAGLTAVPRVDEHGKVMQNWFVVTAAEDCPVGVHDARVLTRLGISAARAFTVGTLPESEPTKTNTTLETASPLALDTVRNAVMTKQSVDFYTFDAEKSQRIVVDCAAQGIDSKLNPVLIVANKDGNDLVVERRGGVIDFTVPENGTYVVKVHDLTFNGGPDYFYRLVLQHRPMDAVVPRLPSTKTVSSFSWPPHGWTGETAIAESEPNGKHEQAQKIDLPCEISGSFFPAADVDMFEFEGKKGDVWWVEVASERLGRPTDASIVVQHVTGEAKDEKFTDIAELNDIVPPIKVSSNGYSYDGPAYNAGSPDVIGKVEIKEDGIHHLQVTDLFGGTRNEPGNEYRLIIRKAAPDFAVVGWALHMTLRNGDRNSVSKPLALRGGAAMPLEIAVVRRDGFDGEINLMVQNLPKGVSVTGLRIPSGKSRGIMVISAEQDAVPATTNATFLATAVINGEEVTRGAKFASMKWPVNDAKVDIPAPRLMADLPVSVSDSEFAPMTLAASEQKTWQVTAGEKLTIPLTIVRRCEFSGKNISLKTYGAGFDGNAAFDVPLDVDTSEAVLDTAKLKTSPGEYTIAFYGKAVAKYRYNPRAVTAAETELAEAEKKLESVTLVAVNVADSAKTATDEQKSSVEADAKAAAEEQKQAAAAVEAAKKKLDAAQNIAKPKDIVDIVVSAPITIRVNPAKEAPAK